MDIVSDTPTRLVLKEPRPFRPFVAMLGAGGFCVVVLTVLASGWILGLCMLALLLMALIPFIVLSRLRSGQVVFDASKNTVTLTNRPARKHQKRALSRLIRAENDYDDDHVEGSVFCGTQLIFDTDDGPQKVVLSKYRRDIRFHSRPTDLINDWLAQVRTS